MGAFEKLYPGVQRCLYDMKWTSLHPVQVKAIEHFAAGGRDLVIAAPTAGGKTEAAFLPLLSTLAESPPDGVGVMYIGPLKALLNDQFRRIEVLCTHLDVAVHKWHGDVTDRQRRTLLERPSGVLLITPESLEAMFVLRSARLPRIFSKLGSIVIDELHSFVGSVRGAQLQSQMYRLGIRCGCDPVRVGLSATLGEPERMLTWLRPGGAPAALIQDTTTRAKAIRLRGGWKRKPIEQDPVDDDTALRETARGILRACRGTTALVFANAKGMIEELADQMKQEARVLGVADEIVVHHGSLSRDLREYAEERLQADRPCMAVCSNTLELGIDIGQVDSVVQVSAPWSVASLVQRLGRSGRRPGEPSKLRGFIIEEESSADQDLWHRLHLEMLRAIAVIELALEGFVEPPETERYHRSTLIHQLLSVLAETGGISAGAMYQRLTRSGAFGPLSSDDYKAILRGLAKQKLIDQMAQGDLILGPKGEQVVQHYTFYAAFSTPEEVRVVHGGDVIGKLLSIAVPPPGEAVILAGRRWIVDCFDPQAKEVRVRPGRAKRPPQFFNLAADVHPRVHAKMRDLACDDAVPTYLDETAAEILAESRAAARSVGGFIPPVRGSELSRVSRVFLWAGSKIQRTVYLALNGMGLRTVDCDVGLEVEAAEAEVWKALEALCASPPDPRALAALAEGLLSARFAGADKFDDLLPDDVWRDAYAHDRLDLPGACAKVRGVVAGDEEARVHLQ